MEGKTDWQMDGWMDGQVEKIVGRWMDRLRN